MATPDNERKALESSAAEEIRQRWREIDPTAFRMAIDDIRHKVVEEGFFSRPVTDQVADVRALAEDEALRHALAAEATDEPLSREDLYGRDLEQPTAEKDEQGAEL